MSGFWRPKSVYVADRAGRGLVRSAEPVSRQAVVRRARLTRPSRDFRRPTDHTASIFAKLGLQPSEDDNRRVLAVLAYLGR